MPTEYNNSQTQTQTTPEKIKPEVHGTEDVPIIPREGMYSTMGLFTF